jgi:hypothetical protein
MTPLTAYLLGAMAMGCFAAALFFFRFFRDTRDRLFLWFGISFLVESLNRSLAAFHVFPLEDPPLYYGIRLLAYSLILWAIVEKNLLPRRRPPNDDE